MAVEVQDILTIDAAFVGFELLRDDAEVSRCSAELGTEILTEAGLFIGGPSSIAPVQGRRLRMSRDRMFVETTGGRTRVAREYPASIDDVPSVVRLARQAVACTDLQGAVPSSFGFNLELVYDQDSGQNALSYLGGRLFAPPSRLHAPWERAGGSGKLLVREGIRQWTIVLEPRLQVTDTSKVFLGVNLHVAQARMPDDEEMEMLLRELWDRAHGMIENLDGMDHE